MKENKLYQFAVEELDRAGMGDKDADYGGALKGSVLELMEVFCKQGHSGMSASMTLQIFSRLANWRHLSPLTSDPAEWMECSEGMWQNRRNPSAFSKDGGKTWYEI